MSFRTISTEKDDFRTKSSEKIITKTNEIRSPLKENFV